MLIWSNSVVAIVLWAFFFWIEFRQFVKQPTEYFDDYWNWIDLTSQFTSMSFLIILNYIVITGKDLVSVE